MKLEVRANHTCALKECKPKVQHEFSAAGRVEQTGICYILVIEEKLSKNPGKTETLGIYKRGIRI